MNGDLHSYTLHLPQGEAQPTGQVRHSLEAICLTGPDRYLAYYLVKRLIDISVSAVLLILLIPLFALIALCIKIDSSGPVLFLQDRAGSHRLNGARRSLWQVQLFRCYKFRSMYNKADEAAHKAYTAAFIRGEPLGNSSNQLLFKLTGDPRVTRIGNILRRTSFDELPQLFNVFLGDMSLVGPRPVPTYELVAYRPHHWKRLAAKPGLTGLWQVKGRCRVNFEGMVCMDLEYIDNQSLWNDFKILLQTIPAVISRRGAK